MHFLLTYDVVEDYAARRAPFRAEHLAKARAAVARGDLVLGGALADPIDGSVLLFRGDSPEAAETFAKSDPYVTSGVVTKWRVRPWTTVVGADAEVRLDGAPLPFGDGAPSRAKLVAFLRSQRHWTISSVAADGAPEAAVVGVALTDSLELVFDTLETTRKAGNVKRDSRVALVMWAGSVTVQIEGTADIPTGADRERLMVAYFETFPDGRARAGWPGILYVRVRPTWIRASDFGGADPKVVTLSPSELVD